jgi:hypothetical protein
MTFQTKRCRLLSPPPLGGGGWPGRAGRGRRSFQSEATVNFPENLDNALHCPLSRPCRGTLSPEVSGARGRQAQRFLGFLPF